MFRSYRARVMGALIATGALVTSCGGTTTPSAAPPSQAASAPAKAAGQLPKPELTKIRLGLSAPQEPVQFAEKYADYLGLYQKYGITDVTITGFEGDGKALQALVAGQLDMYVGGSSTAVNSVTTDTPMKVVSMNSVILDDQLVCQKDIKTAADVKGKRIAISTFGGTSHGAALLQLKALGLTTKDATIAEVGGEGTRVAALKGGSVPCALTSPDNAVILKQQGFNVLVDLLKAGVHWGRSGLMGRVDFLQKNPNTVLVVVAAAIEAQTAILKDPTAATPKFAEYSQTKPDLASVLVKGAKDFLSPSMTWQDDAFLAPRDVLATVNPKVADVDVTKAYDRSFEKTLMDNGFYQKVGAPTHD